MIASVGLALATTSATPARAAEPAVVRAPTCDPSDARAPIDLGQVRYLDPACRRSGWLGLDVGGVVLPARLGLFDRTVWTLRMGPAWAIRLAPWLSLGGRHGLSWYDAGNVRLRVHDHQLEAAAHPLVASGHARMHDRLAIGVETHTVLLARVDGLDFKLGGVRDVVAYAGYGISHRLSRRWSLAWHLQLRHAWVFVDTQRQLRAGVRASFEPRPRHRLALEALAYGIHRNPRQAGTQMPRTSLHAQIAGEYAWLSRHGVGPTLRLRYATGFLAGEAPIYEVREESLSTSYVDLTIGLRARW
ncbi:MAG: hypothetical protein IPK74_27590 [Deltaproteobacteria bacterium]|nr:hypothetical protein [Deltaproteobacteria bacterium]